LVWLVLVVDKSMGGFFGSQMLIVKSNIVDGL
jgi:hypothetical protein